MNIWLRMASFILPITALAMSWAFTHHKSQQGTIWIVPVTGYDPRDLLRGHYVVYRYDWPGLPANGARNYISALCIKGKAPTVDAVVILDQPSAAEPVVTNGCAITARITPGSDLDLGLVSGKLYIAQTKAKDLEKKLFDPKLQSFIRIRIRDDGIITPIKLDFRPRTAPITK